MTGRAILTSGIEQELMAERLTKGGGMEMLKFMMKSYFVKAILEQFEALQNAIKLVGKSKPVVLVIESFFFGSLPRMLGKGIQPTAHLSIGITTFFLSGIDIDPLGPGLAPNSTPDGRKTNIAMTKEVQGEYHETHATLDRVLEELGAPR